MAAGTTKSNGLDTKNVIKNNMPVCNNITETAITISESKARLIYRDHINKVNGELVLTLFGLFLTFLITVLTSDFNDVFEIENSKYFLSTSFILLTIVTGIATVIYFFKWKVNRKKYTENSFITALKGDSEDGQGKG